MKKDRRQKRGEEDGEGASNCAAADGVDDSGRSPGASRRHRLTKSTARWVMGEGCKTVMVKSLQSRWLIEWLGKSR